MTALSHPKPDFVASKLKWIENVHAARVADPSTFGAYAKYNTTLSAYFTPTVAERLLKYNHTTGWTVTSCLRGGFRDVSHAEVNLRLIPASPTLQLECG